MPRIDPSQPTYAAAAAGSTTKTPPSTSTSQLPPNPHLTDPTLAPFLAPTFDPTAYLNSILPALAIPTASQPIIPSKHVPLSELSRTTTSQITALAAQVSRLTSVLNGLTDDILRVGGRIGYEVEVLRGDVSGLVDVLEGEQGGLAEDLKRFEEDKDVQEEDDHDRADANDEDEDDMTTGKQKELSPEEALHNLRTLHYVRDTLHSVTKLFDGGLDWPLPPSLLTASAPGSTFVAAVPPDPVAEQKGQEALSRIRASVTDLVDVDPGGAEGVIKAEKRIEELRKLCVLFKGTMEEKARIKIVDDLEVGVREARAREEREGSLERVRDEEGEGKPDDNVERIADKVKEKEKEKEGRATGFLGGLRRLRDEIYLD